MSWEQQLYVAFGPFLVGVPFLALTWLAERFERRGK